MSYASQVVADGASHYWRLNETSGLVAADQVGGAPGTLSVTGLDGITFGHPGPLVGGSTAMWFAKDLGTTGKVLTAASVVLPVVVSFEAWIKTLSESTVGPWMTNHPAGGASALQLGIGGPPLVMLLLSYESAAQCYGVTPVNDGAWHHVVAVLTGTVCVLYLDGAVQATVPCVRSLSSNAPFAMGAMTDTAAWYSGLLAEVATYPLALTPAQIANHYALRLASPPIGIVASATVAGVNGGVSAAIDTTGATLLVVTVAWAGAVALPTVTDNKGNTFAPFTIYGSLTNQQTILYCLNPVVGPGHVVTVAGANTFATATVLAFSGVSVYHTKNGGNGSGATASLSSGPVTPSSDGALVLTAMCAGALTTPTVTPAGFAVINTPFAAGVNRQGAVGWQIQATAAVIDPRWNFSPAVADPAVASMVFLPFSSSLMLPGAALMRGYTHGFAITPHDTNLVGKPCQALWVGGAGNLSVVLANETVPTVFTGVPGGYLFEVVPKIVKAAGTTATQLIGLSE